MTITLQDLLEGGAPGAGMALYVGQCDREGRYSLYSEGATEQNHLRGGQAAGEGGVVPFGPIFPVTCPGRWPHFHFEVFGDGWTAQLVSAGGTPETGIDLAITVGVGVESVESEDVDNNPPPPGLRPVGPGFPSPPPSP